MKFFILLFFLSLTQCISTTPYKDFVIAQTALSRAKKFQADKLYPKTYMKASQFYKKAVSNYKQNNYEESQTYFQSAIKWAEKAELKARLKQAKEDF